MFAFSQQDVQATNIILNPGLAFGTGEHPTTKLCLLLLKKLIKGEELFLDYGTGSGVLAIAALKVIKFILYFNPWLWNKLEPRLLKTPMRDSRYQVWS